MDTVEMVWRRSSISGRAHLTDAWGQGTKETKARVLEVLHFRSTPGDCHYLLLDYLVWGL